MNLAEYQRILARIVTAPDLLEGFLDDPEGVACSRGWDRNLARLLATIPPHRLRHYGETLVRKRCHQVARCLPLTFRALGDSRFRAMFREHARSPGPRGPGRIRDDAIGFADMLRSERPDGTRHARWLADLAAYEAASLRAAYPGGRIIIIRLGHSPRDLVEAALAGNLEVTVPRHPSLIFWIRLTRKGTSRRFRLSTPRSWVWPAMHAPGTDINSLVEL